MTGLQEAKFRHRRFEASRSPDVRRSRIPSANFRTPARPAKPAGRARNPDRAAARSFVSPRDCGDARGADGGLIAVILFAGLPTATAPMVAEMPLATDVRERHDRPAQAVRRDAPSPADFAEAWGRGGRQRRSISPGRPPPRAADPHVAPALRSDRAGARLRRVRRPSLARSRRAPQGPAEGRGRLDEAVDRRRRPRRRHAEPDAGRRARARRPPLQRPRLERGAGLRLSQAGLSAHRQARAGDGRAGRGARRRRPHPRRILHPAISRRHLAGQFRLHQSRGDPHGDRHRLDQPRSPASPICSPTPPRARRSSSRRAERGFRARRRHRRDARAASSTRTS